MSTGKHVPIADPDVGAAEMAAVEAVLRSRHLVQGPVVEMLEQAIAEACGVRFAVAVNSGTAALHSALAALRIGPGDEVVTTPFTFVATANSVIIQGARVRFADIGADDFNIDPDAIAASITPNTRAIISVDLYGQPCAYSAIQALADKHGIALVEDACQALGASYQGRPVGSLGDIACFSLYATKNVVSGEGGVVTTDSEDLQASVRRFRQHGMTGPYEYGGLGMNYRMTDIIAAIAVEQLKRLQEFTQRRRENADLLSSGLTGIEGIEPPVIGVDRDHVFHQYTIRVTGDYPLTRDELREHLSAHGIGSGVYYPKPLYAYEHVLASTAGESHCPVTMRAVDEVLSLPVHPRVGESDISRITALIAEPVHA